MKILTRMFDIKSKLGKDVIVTFVAQALIMVTFFIVNKVLSNTLGVELYGQYSLIKKNTAVISMVMLAGMGIAIPRFVAFYKAKANNTKANSIVISSLIIVLLVTVLTITFAFVFNNQLETIVIGISGDLKLYYVTLIYSFSICISAFMYSFYRGNGDFLKFNISQIVIQVLILVSCFFVNKQLINVLLFWSVLTIVATVIIVYKDFVCIFSESRQQLKLVDLKDSMIELLPFGTTRLIGDFVLFSFNALPLIFSNSEFGIRQTAFFSVGIMIANMITPLFGFLGMVLLPYVSEQVAAENHQKIKSSVNRLMGIYVVLSVIMTLFVIFFADFVIQLLFSVDYIESRDIVIVLIWTIVAQAVYLLLRNPIDAISKFPLNTINLILSFIVMLVLFIFSDSLIQLTYSFLAANFVLAFLSVVSWYIIYPKFFERKIIK